MNDKYKHVITTLDTTRIDFFISQGMQDKDWYAKTERLITGLYGPHRLQLVSNLLAATSINSSLKSNIRLFRKALHEIENGLPFSNYLPNIKLQLERIRSGQELSGRKIRAFAAAMSGDVNAVVVDVWLLRAFDMERKYYRKHSNTYRSAGATDKAFTLIEEWVRSHARKMKLQPRELSAIIWSGTRRSISGDHEVGYHNVLVMQEANLFTGTCF